MIPPADVDLSQPAYRVVMAVRDRIEDRDVGLEEVREENGAGGESDPDGAVVEALFDRLVDDDVSIPDGERAHLEAAFEALADGEWDAAAERLRERYESVCETHHPEDERAACHLRGLPDDVDPAAVDRVETRE